LPLLSSNCGPVANDVTCRKLSLWSPRYTSLLPFCLASPASWG